MLGAHRETNMTAVRFSGTCSIRIAICEDPSRQVPGSGATYRCVVTDATSRDRAVVVVGSPPVLTQAIDSPEAFDAVAHAAISFVLEESRTTGQTFTPEHDGSGFLIERRSVGEPRRETEIATKIERLNL